VYCTYRSDGSLQAREKASLIDVQEVMPAYARAHAAVHDLQGAVRQRVHFCRTDRRVVLAYVGAEYEVFAQFDALTDRSGALAMCQRLCAYIKNQQSDLFVPMSL